MHSDQMRKDGISESMIQALTLLPTMSRPGCTVVQIVVILSVSKVHECMQTFIY